MNGNMNLGSRLSRLENGDSGGGSQNKLHVYSTEEKVVGKWTDGRNVYEKTFYSENIPAGSGNSTTIGTIDNSDKMISTVGSWKWSGDIDVQPLGNRGGSKAWADIVLKPTGDIIAISSAGCDYLIAIVQYIKKQEVS